MPPTTTTAMVPTTSTPTARAPTASTPVPSTTNVTLRPAFESIDITTTSSPTTPNGNIISPPRTESPVGTPAAFNNAVTVTNPNGIVSRIIEADLIADNGVVHKVNNVLLPDFWVTNLAGLPSTPLGSSFSIYFAIVDILGWEAMLTGRHVGTFTLLVPTDDAFLALGNETLAQLFMKENQVSTNAILGNHVLGGVIPSTMFPVGKVTKALKWYDLYFGGSEGAFTVNGASILTTDVLANNGIVHAIDKVLIDPYDPGNTTTATPDNTIGTIGTTREIQATTTTAPIVDDVIMGESDLSTFYSAMTAAGVVGALCTNCNYTVFAPTNDAFAALDQDYLTTLLTPAWIMHLINLISFHTTPPEVDRVVASDLVDGTVITMLNGESITISLS